MASEDVIELGSSDDEAEPTIKKIKPNAMVHIPRKLHEVTIKPTKSTYNIASCIPKELAGKNVTVTKISKGANVLANPYAIKSKLNGKQVEIKPIAPKQIQQRQPSSKILPVKQMPNFTQTIKNPITIKKATVNPLSIMKKNNSQLVINKVPSTLKVIKNPLKVQSPRTINNLPPSITITRTAGAQKRAAPTGIPNTARKKQKRSNIPKTTTGEVLTVDLDDEEVSSSSTASPQWYLRPEEPSTSLEEQNNAEPVPTTCNKEMIEITIEDSPAKPVKDKRIQEVGTEFTVTIDDSPVKTVAVKNTASGSDGEANTEKKVPNSKKELKYPKEPEVTHTTVEIEISPMPDEPLKEINIPEPAVIKDMDCVIEIEESPLKVQGVGTSTPKKDHPKPQLSVPDSIKDLQEEQATDDLKEFHPVYQSFIRLCFQLENSDDMKKIVEKKIKTYYRQVPKEYTESEEFIDMVAGKVLSMKAGPEKMYLYIKDIVDELNLQRKMAKSQILTNIHEKKKAEEGEKYFFGADSEFDSKRQRQIRKLEKTLKKLHRAIQKLEDQEVDFDDEEDSVYLLTESDEGGTSNKDSDRQLEKDPKALLQRYKERLVRVHAKFCQLTNTKMPSEPRVQIDARPGQALGPAKKLEKWINKKVPIGTPLPFPDFHDVLRCVREANEEDKLGWNEADIMEEARDLFTRCGKKLQRRRQENEWRIAASRISVDVDPAEQNQQLKKTLDDNKKIAAKRETEVFNKYADRQSQLKLEAEEIGEKEAEESPCDEDEDEDHDQTDEKSLENKEKRKERLRRLLQDKSKKTGDTDKQKVGVENKENEEVIDGNSEEAVEMDIQEDSKTELPKDKLIEKKTQDNLIENKEDNVNKSMELENKEEKEPSTIAENKNDLNVMVPIHIDEKTKENDNPAKSKEIKKVSAEKEKLSDNDEKTHSISDDSNKIESDIDELHLLQKLHSENEICTSTLDSSDSETPIAISDTLGSSSDSKMKRRSSDVISIENSSYSESEINKELTDSKDADSKTNNIVEEIVDANIELECSNIGVEKKQPRTNNDEYNESIEDILLASTDDEEETDKRVGSVNKEECVNLKDDSISIGDTVVEGISKEPCADTDSSPGKPDDASSVDSLTCVSLNDQSPSATNMDLDNQYNIKNKGKETCDKNEDINSAEESSENSVHTIESKGSSLEKEIEVIEESDEIEKENLSEGTKDTESIITLVGKETEKSDGSILDAVDESSNGKEKENLTGEISDAVDKSTNSLGTDSATDKNVELPNDNTSVKL